MTLSILVENNFGVLTQITSFFSARGYSIEGMVAAKCEEDSGLAHITIVVECPATTGDHLVRQLHKLTEVVEARFQDQ